MLVVRNRFKELLAVKSRKLGRKISVADAAEIMGIHRTTLEAWARNDLKRFDGEVMIRICNYLPCSIAELLIIEEIGDADVQTDDVS